MAKLYSLDLVRGDDWSITLGDITDSDGNPVDTSGWLVTFTLKRQIADDDSAALVQATGSAGVAVPAARTAALPTGTHSYDVQVVRDGTVQTLLIGKCSIVADVTRTVPN